VQGPASGSSDLRDREGNSSGDPSQNLTRRTFFQWLSVAVLSLWAAASAAVVLAFLTPPSDARSALSNLVDAGEFRSLREGTARLVSHKGVPIYVLRPVDEEIIALSGLCTHFRCVLKWSEEDQTLVCPCHKGVFGPNGSVMAGLPNQPLTRYETHLRGGRILVQV